MGQKVNPHGLRVGVIKNWDTKWFAEQQLLKASIAKLSNRERNIMELRFGFLGGNEKTQKEVADMLGISQSYISRLEKKIIGKMKKEIMSKTG